MQTELEHKLPEALRQEEKEPRQKAYAFIGRVSVEVGDVVTFPALQVHSLQHGIRVIEFQTPHYERLIVMFAQKVLTQNHWDTDRAMDQHRTLPFARTSIITGRQWVFGRQKRGFSRF